MVVERLAGAKYWNIVMNMTGTSQRPYALATSFYEVRVWCGLTSLALVEVRERENKIHKNRL